MSMGIVLKLMPVNMQLLYNQKCSHREVSKWFEYTVVIAAPIGHMVVAYLRRTMTSTLRSAQLMHSIVRVKHMTKTVPKVVARGKGILPSYVGRFLSLVLL